MKSSKDNSGLNSAYAVSNQSMEDRTRHHMGVNQMHVRTGSSKLQPISKKVGEVAGRVASSS